MKLLAALAIALSTAVLAAPAQAAVKVLAGAELGIPPPDQQRLGGASSVHLELEVINRDVGDQQEISKPGGGGYRPIRDLALSLNDLGVPIPL